MRSYIKIGIAVFIVALILVGFFFFRGGEKEFSINDISFKLASPKETEAGEPQDFEVLCKNKSSKALENLKLTLEYSPGILDAKTGLPPTPLFNFDSIPAGGEKKQELKLSLFGKKDDLKEIKAKLEFTPRTHEKTYTLEAFSKTLLSSVPLFLKFNIPSQVAGGQKMAFSFLYVSKSKHTFPGFAAKATYPESFQFLNSNPLPKKENNLWSLGDLEAGKEGLVSIGGNIQGIKEENKKFKIELGIMTEEQFLPIFEEEGTTKIIETFLSLEQLINDKPEYSADIGEVLNFTIKYKNNTEEKLREVFISANLKCDNFGDEFIECLNWKELQVAGGEFDGFTKTLFWRASGSPQLQELYQGEEGEVKFSIVVKDRLPIKSPEHKNFIIESRAKIDINPQYVPLSLAGFEIGNESVFITKINTKLLFDAKGYYNHSELKNSGPVPPKVGEVTTYTIVWKLDNLFNDLSEAVVEGNLPSNVVWLRKVFPEDASIKYENFTGRITWEIGEMEAGTGIVLPKKEVAFQVAVQPTKDLIRKSVDLLRDIKVTAKDSFTDKVLTVKSKKITTDIPDDFIVEKQGEVVP